MQNLIVLELNEVNFDMMKSYADAGAMPNFKKFIERHGYAETTSETNYVELEPWIQWVSVHTGKPYSEHLTFRLGDIETSNFPQIWDELEKRGVSVGAISPMNAANRLSEPAFFVPDPWTATRTDGPWIVRLLAGAVAQAVNDNAKSRLTFASALKLALGVVAYARPSNYVSYFSLATSALRKPWNKVLFLDLFLSDLFIRLNRSAGTRFSTVFLNGGAHLQHHYMYNSTVYGGGQKNPEWYMAGGNDPVGDIYRLYDRIIGTVRESLPEARVMIVTGLHQDPTKRPIFYWRLRDHAAFLRALGLAFKSVAPKMSRDFTVDFASNEDKAKAVAVLESSTISGKKAFNVDHRDGHHDIFVELVYPDDIQAGSALKTSAGSLARFDKMVAFVALKNGLHNGIGYFSDSARTRETMPKSIPLTQIYTEMLGAFQAAAE